MSKLILLPKNEVNRLLRDLNSSKKLTSENIMLGFIRSLDDSNQWANSMVVGKDCNAYRQIFMKQPGEIGGCSA